MKQNIKFFSIVISLLLVSSLVLTGCMYAIATDHGEMKPYDLNRQKNNSEGTGGNAIVEGDAPTAQDTLQAKFEAMYDISEDGKTITVISEEYLNDYWQSNYEKEVIRSLTTEEVYFIIQDSIRIYMEYDKVILTAFGSFSSIMQVAERFPYVEGQEVCRSVTSHLGRDKIESDIYAIILYRLKALSSPKAFFTGEEAILFVGGHPGVYSSMIAWTTFYIPGFSDNTEREYILSVVGQSVNKNKADIDADRYSDLFGFCNKNGASVSFKSKTNGSTVNVYPTEDMFSS